MRFRGNDGFRLFEKNPAFRKRLPRKKTVKTDRFEKGKTGRKESGIFGRAKIRTKHCSGVQGTAFASESILSNKRF